MTWVLNARPIHWVVALLLVCLGTRASVARASDVPAQARPNIVLVLVDDIGVNGFSCYGSDSAPFRETAVTSKGEEVRAAQSRLQAVIDELKPRAGFK